MYSFLLSLHSVFRWLVVLSLFTAIIRSFTGFTSPRPFGRLDNAIRHWTATIAHIQLMIGILLYTQSPLVSYYFGTDEPDNPEAFFFSILHLVLMSTALVIITIGSAKAKRKKGAYTKFKTLFLWFVIALALIFAAVPWPFSPLAQRPFLRSF